MDYMGIITKASLTFTERLVLLYLFHERFEDAGLRVHAQRMGMSIRALSSAIDSLVDMGYVERIVRSPTGKNYNRHSVTDKACCLLARKEGSE